MNSPLPRSPYPVTPDRRYFVVRGRLWRMANPNLSEMERTRLVADLMRARQEVGKAIRLKDADTEQRARRAADAAKRSLGEREPQWWTNGTPDYNRRMVRNTPYIPWYTALGIT